MGNCLVGLRISLSLDNNNNNRWFLAWPGTSRRDMVSRGPTSMRVFEGYWAVRVAGRRQSTGSAADGRRVLVPQASQAEWLLSEHGPRGHPWLGPRRRKKVDAVCTRLQASGLWT